MLAMSDDRSKAIEAALLNIEKKFGKGSIMRLGEREVSDIPAISTTSLSLDAAIISPATSLRLALLPASSRPGWAHQLMRTPRLGTLIAEARQRFDMVVIDTPPVVPVADCRALARWVDGFVMVVAAHKTPRKLVEQALDIKIRFPAIAEE